MQSYIPRIASQPTQRVALGTRAGKVRPAVLAWALGIPIPIILLILIFRGCA